MKALLLATMLALPGGLVQDQEKPVPRDSTRLTVPGCAYDRLFLVEISPEHEMPRTELKPGRRLRLSGAKKLLEEIKARQGDMVELTAAGFASCLAAHQWARRAAPIPPPRKPSSTWSRGGS